VNWPLLADEYLAQLLVTVEKRAVGVKAVADGERILSVSMIEKQALRTAHDIHSLSGTLLQLTEVHTMLKADRLSDTDIILSVHGHSLTTVLGVMVTCGIFCSNI